VIERTESRSPIGSSSMPRGKVVAGCGNRHKKKSPSSQILKAVEVAKGSPQQPRPKPPPKERRTVQHLVSQLEGQMARHSGYVPKKGIPTALLVKYQQRTDGSIAPRSRVSLPWRKNKSNEKASHNLQVRLLPEDEW
jgi:hypothetical protein